MKVFSPTDFSALIGIDWADKKHDVCEYSTDTQRYYLSVISSKPEAIHDWANSLKKKYPHQRIVRVVVFQGGGESVGQPYPVLYQFTAVFNELSQGTKSC